MTEVSLHSQNKQCWNRHISRIVQRNC